MFTNRSWIVSNLASDSPRSTLDYPDALPEGKGVSRLVRAPHRGAFEGSPGRIAILSDPYRMFIRSRDSREVVAARNGPNLLRDRC